MTRCKVVFSSLEEKDLQVHIKMGDDGRYNVTFDRGKELSSLPQRCYVCTWAKKNLIFVAVLEDRGYDVIFNKGKSFLRHIASGKVKQIWVQVKKLYKIEVGDCTALNTSIAKHKYYVIFINDFSRKCWIFLLQKKDEFFSNFVEFKALVEKETEKKVKALKNDNEDEFVSHSFKDLCAKEGIRRELIAPHNPQLNGVAERKNMHIVGEARAMLHD
eukprot:PITA_14294